MQPGARAKMHIDGGQAGLIWAALLLVARSFRPLPHSGVPGERQRWRRRQSKHDWLRCVLERRRVGLEG
jgi:hypothetical protein